MDIYQQLLTFQILSAALGVWVLFLLAVRSRKARKLQHNLDNLRIELGALQSSHDTLKNDYRITEHRREGLEEQVAKLFDLSSRIRHDVPKRLNYLWEYIQAKLPDGADKRQAVEDIQTIMEKIKLHVGGGDIKERTAEALAGETGTTADGMLASELVNWLIAIHKINDRTKLEVKNDFNIRGPRVSWDLMLTNILSNAIHYTEERGKIRGKITIVLRERESKGEVEIINDGPHIPKEDIERVFDEGFSTKEPKGRGLGLYVAQQIALGLGGQIEPPKNLRAAIFKKRVKFTLTGLPIFASAREQQPFGSAARAQ